MAHIVHVATLAGPALPHGTGLSDVGIFWFENLPYAYAGAFSDGGVLRLRLTDGGLEVADDRPGTGATGTLGFSDLALVGVNGAPHLLAAGALDDRPALRALNPATGATGALRQIVPGDVAVDGFSQVVAVPLPGGGEAVVAGRAHSPGLQSFVIGPDFALDLRDVATDDGKAPLADVSALAVLEVAGTPYVIAASALDSGLAAFRVGPGGALEATDTLPAPSGDGFSAITALATLTLGGTGLVLAGSGPAGTLSVFRLNPQGVFFATDHMLDTLGTRFDGVAALATFTHAGRGFAVAGGADAGLSLFEVTQAGRLIHLQALADSGATALAQVSGLDATVAGGKATIVATGFGPDGGIGQFTVDLGALAPPRQGGAAAEALTGDGHDDLLSGGGGNDTLSGGAGVDIVLDGPGTDRLTGGAGADVFVLAGDGAQDTITDFAPGLDRIDLSDWGMLHHIGALGITPLANGARISFGAEVLIVEPAQPGPLGPADFSQDDFIFL